MKKNFAQSIKCATAASCVALLMSCAGNAPAPETQVTPVEVASAVAETPTSSASSSSATEAAPAAPAAEAPSASADDVAQSSASADSAVATATQPAAVDAKPAAVQPAAESAAEQPAPSAQTAAANSVPPSAEQPAPSAEPAAPEDGLPSFDGPAASTAAVPASTATVPAASPATSTAASTEAASAVPAAAPAAAESSSSTATEQNAASSAAEPESAASAAPVDSLAAVGAVEAVEAAAAAEVYAEENPEPEVSKVSFFAIGDVLFHTPLFAACKADASKCNYDHIFKYWKNDIQAADFAAANQETIFVPRKEGFTSYPAFGTPEQVGEAEIDAGFDIITHATNHTIDRGAKNIDYTINFWKDKEMIVLGIHDTAKDQDIIRYAEKKGIRFAFLNNTYGLNGNVMPSGRQYLVDMQDSSGAWLKRIAEADRNADVVVVFMHVGTEYVPVPSADAQTKVAQAIDAGADIVVCAHPHVVEPYGVLKTKKGNSGLVYWSLGNFISNQKENPKLLGGVAKFEVQKTTVKDSSKFEVVSATFEGSVTHWDSEGYRAIPLKDYSDELARKHAGKVASFSEIRRIFNNALNDHVKCGTQKASDALPLAITKLPENR